MMSECFLVLHHAHCGFQNCWNMYVWVHDCVYNVMRLCGFGLSFGWCVSAIDLTLISIVGKTCTYCNVCTSCHVHFLYEHDELGPGLHAGLQATPLVLGLNLCVGHFPFAIVQVCTSLLKHPLCMCKARCYTCTYAYSDHTLQLPCHVYVR